VVLAKPIKADPEIAAATFSQHLADFWETGRPEKLGMERIDVDSLHSAIAIPARRADGTIDIYYIMLGAEYYDAFPPTAIFVEKPAGETIQEQWIEAKSGTRFFPTMTPPPWFGLHEKLAMPGYYPEGRQLVCFTGTAEYYMVSHSPTEDTIWVQGRNTVARTLNRLHEVLQQPYYQRPSGS
jgi:hypothetical protein